MPYHEVSAIVSTIAVVDATIDIDPAVSCSNCLACCCRLEVMLISDTGVPDRFIEEDDYGGQTMARLDDGWCAALDRNTMMCTIYEKRPWVCRSLEMGSYECRVERAEHMG
ncbi:YkgJ family cysteine cluster protein [Marinobacter sp. BGYM27]|uniref:YkgJ family cysteine cluster protein n=1 Tax=unclassified Marinobacter TaxID=83889 RepID=UPI0021A2D5A7|nr:YkgJ family cysteine cluster protein [Marinobacter sp. BGYM27]MDG5499541.1 YkgJ family cysteine cluster protein [Marinobacter sp. BGYM27]